jgi:hypothetical protein
MVTTEVHVPISLNPTFAHMTYFLVKSLAANANFPGDWRVVFTVSRDTSWNFDHPELAWAKYYPVEFRWVEQAKWDVHSFLATIEQRQSYNFNADVVLFMDADTVVAGSLRELVLDAANSNEIAGWPAWQPPNSNLREVLLARGCILSDWDLTYSGYGLAFLSPKWCPPYFNCGFIATPNAVAQQISVDFPEDLHYFFGHYDDWYGCQVSLCLTIVRKNYNYRAIDMRYNLGNGSLSRYSLTGPEADAAFARAVAACQDPRVLHYCVQTEAFSKRRDMGSWDRIGRFCDMEGLTEGNMILQETLKSLL